MKNIVRAADNWGWLLALIVSVVALGVVATANFNPVEKAGGQVAGVLSSPKGLCPSGWTDESAFDEHAIVKSCSRDGWLVILTIDGEFGHGFQVDTPGAVFLYSAEEVPGWPAD